MTTPLKKLLTGTSALTPPVVRDPVSVAIATAITGATSGFAFTAVSILAGIGVSMVVSYALQALAPKQSLSTAGAQGLLVNTRDPAAAREYVYGRVRKGGTFTYYESTNDNKYLHMILVLASHEVAGIDEIYIDDKVATINGSGFVTSQNWNSKIRIKKYLGTSTQTVDPDLLAESNDITSTFRGRDIAYLYIRLEYDPDVFTSGIPLFTANIRGKPILDTRTSVTGYSNNWALCVRDYLVSEYGLGDLAANIDTSYFNTAANISDELTNSPSGQIKRYEMNAVIRSDERVGDVLKKMMTAGAGTLYWGQGKWKIRAGAYSPSVRSIDLDDVRSSLTVQTRQSSRDNFNIVRGTFYNERKRFIEMDYPEVRSATFIAQDNGKEKPFDYELPYTTHPTRCARIARILLLRSREQITISADFGMEMFGVEVGDTVEFTYSRYGWTNKTFEVVSWRYIANEDGELKVSALLREISAAVYSGNVADEQDIVDNDSTLPDPFGSLTITGLAQTSTSVVESDGRLICSSFVTWNAVSNAYFRDYQVQWKLNARTEWNSTFTTDPSIELTGLAEGRAMTVRVRARTVRGNFGAWASLGFTPDGDVTAPTQPTLVQTIPGYDGIVVKWENPANADFKHVEVYVNTVDDAPGSSLLGKTDGEQYLHSGLAIGVTRWYFLKSVDFSGNKSAFTTGVSGTTTGVPTVDLVGDIVATIVADGAVNTASFAAGIAPVEIVATLPATGNFEGRIVYLTTDNKLYRHTGSAWTKAVDGVDITADSITAGQIAAGAISASEIASDAVTTAKLAAGAVTANEIAANAIIAGKIATDAVTSATIAANAITSGKIAANAITAGKIAAAAINTTSLIVDGAVSRRVYAQGSLTTLTTSYQTLATRGPGAGAFAAWTGAVGDRGNPILMSIDVTISIGSGGTGWHTVSLTAGYLESGSWTNFLVSNFKVPLEASGIIQYTKSYVIDSGPWSTATQFRIQMNKNSTPTVIDASGMFMLTQISV